MIIIQLMFQLMIYQSIYQPIQSFRHHLFRKTWKGSHHFFSTESIVSVDVNGKDQGESRDDPDSTNDQRYRLIDHGEGLRLEKFGKYTIIRPSKTSRYERRAPLSLWENNIDFRYSIDPKTNISKWENVEGKDLSNWTVEFDHIKFKLSNYDGGQVGLFPEQSKQWNWLGDKIRKFFHYNQDAPKKKLNILNGFAYTGGSTLACLIHPNVMVTNLDSSKSATVAAKQNFELSKVKGNVRWITDDCQTFVNREIRRAQEINQYYDGVIFDPPAFGRSKDKKTWQINRDLPILLESIPKLLSKNPTFVLVTCHDSSWPANRLENTLFNIMKNAKLHGYFESGSLTIKTGRGTTTQGRNLDLGSYVRWSRLPIEKEVKKRGQTADVKSEDPENEETNS